VGLYLLARQYVRPFFAGLVLATFALLFPIPQVWTPYPAWYALGGLLVGLLAMLRWLAVRCERWVVAAGLGCAWAFASKPNLGLFGLAAFGGFFLLHAQSLDAPTMATRPRRAGAFRWLVALQAALLLALVGAFGMLLLRAATPPNTGLFLASLAASGTLLIQDSGTAAEGVLARRALRRLAILVGVFVLATTPWYIALSAVAGWGLTFDTIFLSGARAAAAPSFYAPLLLPDADAVVLGAAVGAGALIVVAPGMLRRLPPARRRAGLLVAGALAVAGAGLIVIRAVVVGRSLSDELGMVLREGLFRDAVTTTDFVMYVPFLALWLGIGTLAWQRACPLRATWPALQHALLVWFLALFLFQLFPRVSYMHLLLTIGPFLVLLESLRARLWNWAAAPVRVVWRPLLFGPLLLFPALLLPVQVNLRLLALAQSHDLALPHAAGIQTNGETAAQLRFARQGLKSLGPNDSLFAYPAMPYAYLLLGHANPTRENYLPGGYWGEDRQRLTIAQLEQAQPRFVLWDQELVDRWGLFAADRLLVNYLWTRYRAIGSAQHWVLLQREAPA
jgi:hypothetical protein